MYLYGYLKYIYNDIVCAEMKTDPKSQSRMVTRSQGNKNKIN